MLLDEALKSAALALWDRGWSVFPLKGKLPAVQSWESYQASRPSREQVERWWTDNPTAGIALALGPVSGVVRLDVDSQQAAAVLQELVGFMPTTPTFVTPAGGVGYLFQHTSDCCTDELWKGDGEHQQLFFMAEGRYTVVPPSPHPDGGVYTWSTGLDAPLALPPRRLLDIVREHRAAKALRALEAELGLDGEKPDRDVVLDALQSLPEALADSYETWVQVGMALRSVGEDLLPVWDEWSQKSAKYRPGECAKKWASFTGVGVTGKTILKWARDAGWRPSSQHPLTDMGNACRFVDLHRGSMLYCHLWSKWLTWDGARWRLDDDGAPIRAAKRVFVDLLQSSIAEFARSTTAALESDSSTAQLRKQSAGRFLQHAVKSQSRRSVEATLFLSQSELAAQPSQFDSNPWVVNCPNGVIDLRTGELIEHKREYMLSKLCPTEYSVTAVSPRWLSFLDEVFSGSQNLVLWLQKLLGYCLSGATTEHVLPVFWGAGANGKSTLVSTVLRVMGSDYAGKAPAELLLMGSKGHPTVKATLFGMRLMAAVETGDGARLDEVMVKELTGDDPVTCRRLYEDFWTFLPTHKLLLATNYKPEIRGTDHAVWRRMRLIPFTRTFDAAQQDKDLGKKLMAEAGGVLTWMVQGCLRWQREGLGEPAEVVQATAEYRSEQDRFMEFITENYAMAEGCRIRISEVTAKYSNWCRTHREPELTGKAFGQAMQERGVMRDESKRYYVGIKEL